MIKSEYKQILNDFFDINCDNYSEEELDKILDKIIRSLDYEINKTQNDILRLKTELYIAQTN